MKHVPAASDLQHTLNHTRIDKVKLNIFLQQQCITDVLWTHRSAWPVQTQTCCPRCCSSTSSVWTGTGTPWFQSWLRLRCTSCGPGRAGRASSGPVDHTAAVYYHHSFNYFQCYSSSRPCGHILSFPERQADVGTGQELIGTTDTDFNGVDKLVRDVRRWAEAVIAQWVKQVVLPQCQGFNG